MKNEGCCQYGTEYLRDCRLIVPQDTFATVIEVSDSMYLEDVLSISFKRLKLMWDIIEERNQSCRSIGVAVAADKDTGLCSDKLIFFGPLQNFDCLAISFLEIFKLVVGKAVADKEPVKYVLVTLDDIYVKTGRKNL